MHFTKPSCLRYQRSKPARRAKRRAVQSGIGADCAKVEALEDRKMLTIVYTPAFGKETEFSQPTKSNPYLVMQSPTVHVVFWGSHWFNGIGTITSSQVDPQPYVNEISNILASPYLQGLKEYLPSKTGTIGNVTADYLIDPSVIPSAFDPVWNANSTKANNASLKTAQNELQSLINNSYLAGPGTSDSILSTPIYLIVVDPSDSGGNNGGFNYLLNLANQKQSGQRAASPQQVNYIQIATSADLSNFGDTVSNEMAEKITDANEATSDFHGVLLQPSPTTPDNVLDGGLNQVADGEPEPAGQPHYSYDIGGNPDVEVQPFWSVKTGAYVVPDGNAQQFTLSPNWDMQYGASGGMTFTDGFFTDTYNLTINGDQRSNKNDNITISSDARGGIEVNLNGEVAYFDAKTASTEGTPVLSITVNGGGGNDTLKVDFTNGDPIPAGGITFNGGGGTNTIQTAGDGSFFLSNSSLQYGFGGKEKIALTDVQRADLVGGIQSDFFSVGGWTGGGSINSGGGLDSLNAIKDADMTLTGTRLTASDGMNLTLFSMNNGDAALTGGPSANTLAVSGWTGMVRLDGEGGNDTYNVNWSVNPGVVTVGDSGTGDSNTLNINDQSNPDLANTVVYTATAGQIRRNGQDRSPRGLLNDKAVVKYTNVSTVNVNPSNNGNKLTAIAIGQGTNLVYNAGIGSDAVTAGGAANDLDPIAGTLTVNGRGNTMLTLADAPERSDSSSSSPVYTITDATVTRVDTVNGTVLGPNRFVYDNLAILTIDGGRFGNVFDVQSTAATIPVSINAGRGDDTVHIGSASDTLDGIQGVVTVNGQQGTNNLNIFDDGTATSQYYDMLANQFTRTPTTIGQPLGSPTQTIDFQNISFVAARLGSAYDFDGVTSTAAGTSYTLDPGSGFNEILVGSNADTLDSIQGPLAVHGNGANTLLDLIDELNPVGHIYTMAAGPTNGNFVARDQMANISYDKVDELILATGDNPYTQTTPSTVDVSGTAANTFTVAVVTSGDTVTLGQLVGNGPTHTLQNFLGGLRVQSTASETPSVLIDDSGDTNTAARTVSFNSDYQGYHVDGLAPQPIYVQTGTGSSVSVLGDNADETFKVNALPPGVAFSLNGEGGVNALDYSGWTGDVTVDLPSGHATGFTGSISSIRDVVGSNGNNILVGDAQPNTLTGGSGRNILIGGAGADILNGGLGQNILIGGATDDDLAALDAVMAAWPLGDPNFAAAAHSDGAADTLNGGGQNWFLFAPGEDQLANTQPGDLLTSV
jgi:hypothetical protein